MPMASTPLDEAQQLYRMGEFDRSINRYKKIISDGDSDAAAAYAGLARVYLKLKKPEDAFTAAKKAVELDLSLATAHSALGEVYLRQGLLYDAQQEFLIPFKMNQLDARAYLGLSRLYRATFNFKKAKVTIDKAYALDPADPDIRGAWMETRPRSEKMKTLGNAIASQSNFYSRAEKGDFKERLALMKDRTEHPERTCSLENPPASAELRLELISTDNVSYRTGLDVRVNGQKSRLEVVTGPSDLTINRKIAEKAGVQLIVRTAMDDLGDQPPRKPTLDLSLRSTLGIWSLRIVM
jgi:tetratricopeptide (TPR) repeat protein